MSGRSHGSDYELHIFTDEGRVEIVQANDFNAQPNLESSRIQRSGSTESEPETRHNGWQVEATFDRESFIADKLIDEQAAAYHGGEPMPEMELMETVAVPKIGGATKTWRYTSAAISSWQDNNSGQDEPGEISITFQTGRRVEL